MNRIQPFKAFGTNDPMFQRIVVIRTRMEPDSGPEPPFRCIFKRWFENRTLEMEEPVIALDG
ncbi:MAG: hypothetical protein ACTSU9_03470 [Promethearchaeota archaeon]